MFGQGKHIEFENRIRVGTLILFVLALFILGRYN